MPIRGKIKKGKVILDKPAKLKDGTEVEVRAVKKTKFPVKAKAKPKVKFAPRSLTERLKNFIGTVTELPPDASINHDYYLYGTPKRQ